MTKKLLESLDPEVYKINIAGFSLDNYKTFNPEEYTILCRLGENCESLKYFPNTSKIVLDSNQQSRLLYSNLETDFISNVAKDLKISNQAAIEKSMDFFSDKTVVVQITGFQGKIFNMMRYAQNTVPMVYTADAVSVLKTTGMTGIQIVKKGPLTFVGATYIGALFFSYCGSIVGNNPVGSILNFTSYTLSLPMQGVEITVNGLILRPISNFVGLPLILNGTQEMRIGKGMSLQEYTKIGIAFERISNSNTVKKAREIWNILTSKD